MSNPSEALAAHILDCLVAEGLLLSGDVRSALPKFTSGKLNAEDWRLYVEKAMTASSAETAT